MTKRKNVNENVVKQIEKLLEMQTTDTRAAVAAMALPGRIRAFSPHCAALRPEDQQRLAVGVDKMMRERGTVLSATGITAALAVNWCEARGGDYTLTRCGETYGVETITVNLRAQLTEAEWLVRELEGHEGAEGLSEYLRKRLDAYKFATDPWKHKSGG